MKSIWIKKRLNVSIPLTKGGHILSSLKLTRATSLSYRFIALLVCLFAFTNLNAQKLDSITPIRDNIGDLNEAAIRKGDFPGAIRLPGTDVSLAIGGFIKAVALYDTRYNEKNEILLPGTFSPENIYKGQTYMGAKASRLYFDGRSTIKDIDMRGYFEMNFTGASGFNLRHAYLELSNKKGQKLLMGQYWSLIMDLEAIPEGLVEPTISGLPFIRLGQIRFSTPLSKTLALSVSMEEPRNSDLKGVNMIPLNKYPLFVGSLSIDPSSIFHFSIMGMVRPMSIADLTDDSQNPATGYLSNATLIVKPNDANKLTLAGLYGSGASNYLLGADSNTGYFDGIRTELQTQHGGFGAYRHEWNEKFRSNFAYGMFVGDEIPNNPNPHIKSSTFAFINTFYRVNRYVNIGVEWIYSAKENFNGGKFNNNRFQFGIQLF
ncbi:DcaP family trimeric outer membrane transporter [Algoriphagus namhaensis]|uniref:DcaP family trimeric outer membrane transporter n=1 Tax=Algoriphagus namhaensis TaxID=915353 RepID=A0ABV8AL34_9BACT